MDPTPLQEAVDGWLAEGPLSIEELADRAVQADLVPSELDDEGFGPVDAIVALLERSDDYWTAHSDTDEEFVVLARTFVDTGMTFTHRVADAELDAEAVDLAPDLSVLEWACDGGLPLDDGSGRLTADYLAPGTTQLSGPMGWLEAVRAGDVLAFRRTDGVLSVEVVDEAALGDGAAEIAGLLDAAAHWIASGHGMEEVPLLMEAMARDASLFRRPVPPVGELLVAAGLEQRGHEWGRADEEWQSRKERFDAHDRAIRGLYGFDHCCDEAFDRVEAAFAGHARGEEIDGRALVGDLAHGSVAAAFVHARAATPHALLGFADATAGSVGGRQAAPALTLLGLASLRAGDPERAVEALEAAVRADPDFAAAAGALALLEADRGNLGRAHTLAVRDGADPGLVEWLADERARQAALRPRAGRNDPCPCGSGKKFKRCCAVAGRLTMAQRVPFVLQRLAHYASGPEGHDTMFGLVLSAASDHEDVVDAIGRFLQDPFLIDVAIHEGGLGDQYLEQRGALLAEDERELIGAVLDVPRRLWEITAVEPGESLTLRDTRTGDRLTVSEHSGSRDRAPGELMLARVTSADGVPSLFGVPLLVQLRQRDRVLRMLDGWPDADELATWFGSLFLPPRLTNREGEELVLRRTICEIAVDDSVVTAALDETYERQGDDEVWQEMVTIDGHDRVVRGVLRLDGPLLTVESNSEERQDRLLAALDELFDYVIVDDGEIDGTDLDDEPDQVGLLDLDDLPDDVRAVLEESIADYERRWVEEPVPALGDLTPRQALDDPTRREDLFALLREMRSQEPPAGAVGMSAERVERLLGIDRT